MGLWLKQSTAVDFLAGPFVDDGDGKTPETGLTITQAEVRLSKNGGNMAQKNEATALSHDELGMYVCKLDATDTNTLGTLQVTIYEAGALMVYHEFMVVPANTYDSLISGSDYIDSQVRGLDNIDLSATMKASVNTEADTALTDYDPPTKAEMDTGHGLLATEAKQDVIDGIVDAILVDTNELQTDWTNGGRLDLIIDSLALEATVAALNDFDPAADTVALVTDITTKTGFSLSAAGVDGIHDEAVEGAITLRQAVKLILAALTGKTSEAVANTLVIRDANDTADRITATMDANRYRTGVVLNP